MSLFRFHRNHCRSVKRNAIHSRKHQMPVEERSAIRWSIWQTVRWDTIHKRLIPIHRWWPIASQTASPPQPQRMARKITAPKPIHRFVWPFYRFFFSSASLNDFQFHFQATKPTFLAWYNGHKAKLQSEQPDLIPSELTKYAMGKYREIYSAGTNGSAATFKTDGAATAKRKIENENGNEPSNGVAKLAKFNFTKWNAFTFISKLCALVESFILIFFRF